MKLNLNQTQGVVYTLDPGSKWCAYAAASMGIAFFLRIACYFAFSNLRDIGAFEIVFSLVLPVCLSAAFILTLKIPKLRNPLVLPIISAAIAVNYFLSAELSFSGILCGVLQLCAAATLMMAALGKLPNVSVAVTAGIAAIIFRVLFVDLFGFILPLTEFSPAVYLNQSYHLFALAAIAFLCLDLRRYQAPSPAQ